MQERLRSGEDAESVSKAAIQPSAEPAFRRILCGVDDSRPSAEAARQATLLARHGGRVAFVAVCSKVGEGARAMASLNAERADGALREAVGAATRAGVSASSEVLHQADPAAALLRRAAEYDLVAVGSHGGSRAAGIFFGSTASTLVHRAGVPVLVARRPPGGDAFPGNVLLASDGSSASDAAARLAARIGRASGEEITVVHVGDRGTRALREALARQTVELQEATGREPTVTELSGEPHDEIPRLASEIDAGLVVLGSRGVGGVKALGSVSERVAHHAPCSVLVVREPA